MHANSIYSILKSVLAKLTGKEMGEIFSDDNLRTDLRFNDAGLFSLSTDLNEAFLEEGIQINPVLHGDETRTAQTVYDLRVLISGRF